MNKYNPIFFLLFILLVMGAFASMAQNSYGLRIMGGVAFMFGLIFLIEFLSMIRSSEEKNRLTLVESGCLIILSVLFGFRVFYIHFPYVEWVFGGAALILAFIYFVEMLARFRHFQNKNRTMAILLVLFHLSIILFLFSLALAPFIQKTAEYTGIVAFILMLIFIAAALIKKDHLVDGDNISPFRIIRRFKGHPVIISCLFLLFSLFVGFNKAGLIPDIYSDEYPRAYFELLNSASSKKEKPEDGKYKYEKFMQEYQRFLDHNNLRN